MPKDEFIQIDLELSPAHTMIRADQPLLKVADSTVGQGHRRFRTLAQISSERLTARDVMVTTFFQARKALKAVSVDGRAGSHVPLDESLSTHQQERPFELVP